MSNESDRHAALQKVYQWYHVKEYVLLLKMIVAHFRSIFAFSLNEFYFIKRNIIEENRVANSPYFHFRCEKTLHQYHVNFMTRFTVRFFPTFLSHTVAYLDGKSQ